MNIDEDGEYVEMKTCQQCFREYTPNRSDDGFCSDACMDRYNAELSAPLEEEDE